MNPTSGGSGGGNQLTPAQLNQIARSAIKQRAVNMTQQIFSQTFGAAANTTDVTATNPVVTINPRNVGLIKGFWVKVVAVFNNQSGNLASITDFNVANLLSQIQFNDLNNNTRIQTTGWHIAFLNSIKARRPFGSALNWNTGFDSPIKYGDNFAMEISAPHTIANDASASDSTCVMWYWVPLAYSNDDLRGAVYANVVNATMQLNLTLNPQTSVTTGTDDTSAVYDVATSSSGMVMSQVTITVYQNYLDQLPVGQGGVILPILDLATIYEMKNTTVTSIVANQDFPIQYANYRDFLSTMLVYNNNTEFPGGRTGGTDLNYLALQSANFTNIWKIEPALAAMAVRNHMQADLPDGVYYFGSREKPISTVQYGNMQIILNANSTIASGAYALMGYEDFALVQTLSMAGSLAAS